MRLVFVSDDSIEYEGFSATYTSGPPAPTTPPTTIDPTAPTTPAPTFLPPGMFILHSIYLRGGDLLICLLVQEVFYHAQYLGSNVLFDPMVCIVNIYLTAITINVRSYSET